MPGVWSVDAIQILPRGHQLRDLFHRPTVIRMVCYHPRDPDGDTVKPSGIRHLVAPGEAIADWTSGPDSVLSFGRALEVPWSDLHDAERRIYVLGEQKIRSLYPLQDIESALRLEMNQVFSEAPEALSESRMGGSASPARLEVLDVGQGDTLLLAFPDGTHWLVDAFASTRTRFTRLLSYLTKRLDGRPLEKLIISHFHYDHIKRAKEIIKILQPSEILVPVQAHSTSIAHDLILSAGKRLRLVTHAHQYQIGSCEVTISPTVPPASSSDPNEHALVVYLRTPNSCTLLPGDTPAPLLESLIQSNKWVFDRDRSIYKVTHHCSQTGNSAQLLKTIRITHAATSCAKINRYSHPHISTKRLIDGQVIANGHALTFNPNPITYLL